MNLKIWMFGVVATLALAVAGCGDKKEAGATGNEQAVGENSFVAFAQANSADPWRQVFDAEMKAEAEKHPEMNFELQTAQDDASKQMEIIETFMVKEPKVLLVSAADKKVAPAIEKAYDAGVPVILLDRGIDGNKYTTLIGGDNVEIGRQAAQFIAEKLNNKGTVLMIRGIAVNSATEDRTSGAMEVWSKIPGIKVINSDHCDYQREKARSYMETFLQGGQHIEAIYAHNDEMAIGAYLAWEAWAKTTTVNGLPPIRPLIVGIDACQVEIIDYIRDGKIDATFKYPNPGPKGIQVAAEILNGKKDFEKKIVLPTEKVTKETAEDYLKNNPKLHK
jgi:ribose transport system substrate-binding protein